MRAADVSGLVLTHAERDPSATIGQLAEICNQVVVVNDARSGSFAPSTLGDVANDCNITVVERQFDTFAQQRNAGLARATGSWALLLDSDELLSPALSQEIGALAPDSETAVFGIERQEHLNGRRLAVSTHSGRIGLHHPRLFSSDLRYTEHPTPHPRLQDEYDLPTLNLTNKILHYPTIGILELWRKSFRYGRQYDPSGRSDDGPSSRTILRNLTTFVREDGVYGAVMAGAVIAFGLAAQLPHVRTPDPTPTNRKAIEPLTY